MTDAYNMTDAYRKAIFVLHFIDLQEKGDNKRPTLILTTLVVSMPLLVSVEPVKKKSSLTYIGDMAEEKK